MNALNGKAKTVAGQFAAIKAEYEATKSSRFIRKRTGISPRGTGADYHVRNESDYYKLIELARDMDRNDALIGILADRRVDNIVQSGFTCHPQTGDKKLDLDLWQAWKDFCNDPEQCDIAGEMTFHDIERHACRAESIDGDIVVVGVDDSSFQVLESHNIQTVSTQPGVFLGVETNDYGKRTKYHIVEETDNFGGLRQGKPIAVRASDGMRQLFHIYNPKRANQTRGISQLAPIVSIAGMLEDINFAKLVQQQTASCVTFFRERTATVASGPPSSEGYGFSETEDTGAGVRFIEGYSPGMELIGAVGEKLSGFSPNIPNSEYFEQVRMILQIIGVNFGLPLCLVLMDGSETNFSGWRGAVDEARKGFVADQVNLRNKLHTPAYKWWLSRRLETDAALRKAAKKSSVNLYGHEWHLPTWSYIEPVADAEGDATQLRNALTSPRRLYAARGKDWEEVAEEIIEDNSYAISRAMAQAAEVNAANPGQPALVWRDLLPIPMAEGATLSMQDPALIEAQATKQTSEPVEVPSGEMAGLSRQQWNRNRKAIQDVLSELASKQISETKARVFLEGIGLTQSHIDALIADASDGSVDSPEVIADV
jgi:lambda family phage portal protein